MAQWDGAGRGPGERLAAELRAARDTTGLSLKQLRFKVHASDSSLSRYLTGRIVPPWEVVEQLCLVAGRPSAQLKPLWEQADLERRRQAGGGAGSDNGDDNGQGAESRGSQLDPADVSALSQDSKDSKPHPVALRHRWRSHPRAAIAALLAATALVFGGLGIWIGMQISTAPRTGPALQQDDACRAWPWPDGAPGRVALAPAQVHGTDHTATVQLVTGTLAGQSVVWAQITGARYGDRVWIDVSSNAGMTWTQCGPFTTTGAIFTSRAHVTGPQWRFRACGDTPIPAATYTRNSCTLYW